MRDGDERGRHMPLAHTALVEMRKAMLLSAFSAGGGEC
jgi:hypothetical protein